MIFDSGDDDSKKLQKASAHFLKVIGQHTARRQEMDKAFAFRHGQQWDSEAKRDLENQGRPCLTFNLINPTMREMIGANQDQRREASVAPVGAEDLPTSEVVNHLWRREFERGRFNSVDDTTFDKAITGGVGFAFIDAQPDYDYAGDTCISYKAISPYEVYSDILASEPNLTDSPFFYWPRWLTEAEWKIDYPEFADRFDELKSGESVMGSPDLDDVGEGALHYFGKTASDIYRDIRFFKEDRIRVIHLEYKVAVRKFFAMNPQTNEMENVEADVYKRLRKLGLTETYSTMGCEWRWFEFTGLQVLFDDKQPLDLGGKSQIRAYTCYYDDSKKYHYGMVRDLMDPQSEFNKRYSRELEQAGQLLPSILYDTGAFGADAREAERKFRQGGALIEKKPGLSIEPMPGAPPATAQQNLRAAALDVFSRVSGVDTNPLLGGQAEQVAVGTAYLAHRKGILSISTVLENFRVYQQDILDCVVRIILQSFSDEQIEAMLGDTESLKVKDGVVYDTEKQTQIPLDDIRSIRWNIEMDTAAVNTTQQLLLLNVLQSLQAAGVPVDPEVLFENVPVSREQQQRLMNYAKDSQASAAQAQQQQAQVASKQVNDVLTIEMGKVQQRAQEAAQKSGDTRMGQQLDLLAKLIATFNDSANASADRVVETADTVAGHALSRAQHRVGVRKSAAELALAEQAQNDARAAAAQPAA